MHNTIRYTRDGEPYIDYGKDLTAWSEVFSGMNRLRSHEFPTDQGDRAQAKREEDELMALVDDLAADNDRLRAENERLRRRLREHGLPVDLVEPSRLTLLRKEG